jgi:hypothetical protein
MGLSLVLLAAISLTACPAAIPLAIYYYKTHDNYVATAEVKVDAEKVFAAAVSLVEKRKEEGKIKDILTKDDSKLFLEVTDGRQKASAKVIPIKSGVSKLVVTADVPDTKEMSEELERQKEQELALRIMKNICDELGVNYQLIEE